MAQYTRNRGPDISGLIRQAVVRIAHHDSQTPEAIRKADKAELLRLASIIEYRNANRRNYRHEANS